MHYDIVMGAIGAGSFLFWQFNTESCQTLKHLLDLLSKVISTPYEA